MRWDALHLLISCWAVHLICSASERKANVIFIPCMTNVDWFYFIYKKKAFRTESEWKVHSVSVWDWDKEHSISFFSPPIEPTPASAVRGVCHSRWIPVFYFSPVHRTEMSSLVHKRFLFFWPALQHPGTSNSNLIRLLQLQYSTVQFHLSSPVVEWPPHTHKNCSLAAHFLPQPEDSPPHSVPWLLCRSPLNLLSLFPCLSLAPCILYLI